MDAESDAAIQQTVRREFPESTVLTIAHRIGTVLDSDTVLVMDQGTVVENAPPSVLLAEHSSMFAALARQAGIS